MTERVHLVLCLSEQRYGVPDVVNHHYSIAFKYGAVWFGKPDRGISRADVDKLNKQIEQGFHTAVFVVNLVDTKVVHIADLLHVSLKSPPEKQLIPSFYKQLKLLPRMKAWLKLAYPIDGFSVDDYPSIMKTLAEYKAIENKFRKSSPAGVSMPGYFLANQVT